MRTLEYTPGLVTTVPLKKDQRHRLVILMPMMWSIRNVVHSGLLDLLAEVDVYLLLHKYEPSMLQSKIGPELASISGCEALCIPPVRRHIKGLALLREVIGYAFNRRNAIGSYAIYQRWYNRRSTRLQHLRRRMIEIAGYLSQPSVIFFQLYRLYHTFYQMEFDLEAIRHQLRELSPDLVLSTVNVEVIYERAYIMAAKSLGIPVVNAVLSFDNLTSKAAHLLYDEYFVWNQRMKGQLLAFYPQVRPEQVWITGTPQFDFHRCADYHWERENTLKRLGLPPEAKYFLYSASPRNLTPQEPHLVGELAKKMQRHPALKDYWLVVRIHPHDDWSRWEALRQSSDKLVLSETWERMPDANGWTLLTTDDLARLTSSLVHAVACINIASTITLDAAILDRPVIGIRFEQEPDAPHEILFAEYDTDHFRPLVESGGLRIAYSWNDLMVLLQHALEHPGEDRAARARMVAEECGMVDGRCAQRVANALLACLEKNRG